MKKIAILLAALSLLAIVGASAATATTPKKPAKPVFDKRFSCVKALPLSVLNAQWGSWQGDVAVKSIAKNVMGATSGTNSCTYKQAGGAHAGAYSGSLIVMYGSYSAKAYKSDEYAAKTNSGKFCASLTAQGKPLPTDPRGCGPVEIPGLGTHAYVSGSYIAAIRGNVFIQFIPGPSIVDDQYVPSSTLPSQEALIATVKGVLARVPKR